MKHEPITRERIDELLHFLPLFSRPTEDLGPRWTGGKNQDGVFSLPIPKYPTPVAQFFELAAHPCWNDYDYCSKPAHEMLADDAVVASATLDQIKTMLTSCVRGEKFCDGHWEESIKEGRVGAILARLHQLRETVEPSDAPHIEKLKDLLDKCWNAFDDVHDQPFVVKNAVPVLYFGDIDRYFASELKVVTVGLNPSLAEFPQDDPFLRFPLAREAGGSRPRNLADHLTALNWYFRIKPYKKWFGSLEPILEGLGASYYRGMDLALHTDICSPIATAPTWSGLAKDERAILQADGVHIWHSLIEVLSPDIIVVSVGVEHLNQLRFPFISPEQNVFTLERKHPYRVWGRFLAIDTSSRCFLVFGRASQTPFGTVSKESKLKIGEAIREKYDALAR